MIWYISERGLNLDKVSDIKFNHQKLIRFRYNQRGDDWRLQYLEVDPELREFFGIEKFILPKKRLNWPPWGHLRHIMEFLYKHNLDGGNSLVRTSSDSYEVEIEVKRRKTRYHPG